MNSSLSMEPRRETVVQFYENEDDPRLKEEERLEKRHRLDNNDKYDVDRYLNNTVGHQDIFDNWTMITREWFSKADEDVTHAIKNILLWLLR